jgi:hypothetical protein
MENFVIYTVIGLSALAGIVFIAVAGMGIYCLCENLYKAITRKPEVLPPPDKATRRTYDQTYFDNVMSKD